MSKNGGISDIIPIRIVIGVIFINELIIQQLCNNMSIGSTEPKFAILEDGTQAIVKLKNGPEGNLVLFNEYLCYRLAILLDIPMPRSGICIMNEKTEIQDDDIAGVNNYGMAFYSTYMPKTTKLLPTIIGRMKNKEDFIKVILFDHIIFNSDRNPGNLLVSFYKNNILLKVIDHSHVFINQALWNSGCLERAMIENDLSDTKILDYNRYLYDMFFHNISVTKELLQKESLYFKNRLNCDIITEFIEAIPNEWKPSQGDMDSLVKYLMYRINNLDVIISTIMNYIKK